MKTLKLGAKDFKESDSYYKIYIGKTDVSDFDGHIEIEGNLGRVKFNSIKASGHIISEAGCGIEAGEGIKAGWGIEAGWGIFCKLSLNISLRIFAGLCLWRKPTDDETKIICGKLEKGEVCYGNLIETGLPEEKKEVSLSGKEVSVTIDKVTYSAIIK